MKPSTSKKVMLIWSCETIKDGINSTTTQGWVWSVPALGWTTEKLETPGSSDWTRPGLNIIKFWPFPGFWGASVWPRMAGIWSHNKEVTESRLKRRVIEVFGVMASGTYLRSRRHMDGTGPRKGPRRWLYFTPKWKGVISESLIAQGLHLHCWLPSIVETELSEMGRNQYLQGRCRWCAECYIK